jgi:hypothetical protein
VRKRGSKDAKTIELLQDQQLNIEPISQNLISQSGLCCCMSSFDCVVYMVVWWIYVFCPVGLFPVDVRYGCF